MSAAETNQNIQAGSLTLGDLLYADPKITYVAEIEWLALVQAMGAGDKSALRTLFEKTYPLVFTYLTLCTGDRRHAENLISEVFEILWCEAPVFDSTNAPVLGWVMRQARVSALAFMSGANPVQRGADTISMALFDDGSDTAASQRSVPSDPRLRRAFESLTVVERESLEAALIHGASYSEVAERQGKTVGSIKKAISSGLAKLRHQLQDAGTDS